eukprot:TRINITY_DN22309_c0_g2_i1.p1 TRINITY_DN22309_c0_g2~~TRINITY_DN22309_c0_g2_i1.p1  ORF type:complete len:619 (+),score=162.90 TRINITY_DN22309_c0_g2_i1:115-1971(+)
MPGSQQALSVLALPQLLAAHFDNLDTPTDLRRGAPLGYSEPLIGALQESFPDVDSGRQLSVACVPQSIWTLEPLSFEAYSNCIEDNEKTHDMSTVGAFSGIRGDCWCENNMKALVDSYSCCGDLNWAAMCEISCDDADCESAEAKQCLEDCPAICLEEDYAFAGCKCDDCMKYLRCIAGDARNKTEAGDIDLICHDRDFDSSEEAKKYLKCVSDSPLRTNWNRLNTRAYCICDANVSKAAVEHNCCEAAWARDICNDPCRTEDECATPEAQNCAELCQQSCGLVHPNYLSQECLDNCYAVTAQCNQWKTCKPTEPQQFDYICDDGSAPASNGCCTMPSTGRQDCPIMCDLREQYQLPHGRECLCYQCPATMEALNAKMNATIVSNIWSSGQATLIDIARQAGLELGPTQAMQELMRQRNEKLLQMVADHEGPVDQQLEAALNLEAGKWNKVILEEAIRFKACMLTRNDPNEEKLCDDAEALAQYDKDKNTPTNSAGAPTPSGKEDEDEGGVNTLVIVVCLGAVALLAGALGVVLVMYKAQMNKAKRAEAAMQTAMQSGYQPGVQPRDGDINVVVGRPVAGPSDANAAAAASSGAPVAAAEEGDADMTKGKDPSQHGKE